MISVNIQVTKSNYRNQWHSFTLILEFQRNEIKFLLITTAQKPINYLGINLTTNVKDLYDENCKILQKGIEETHTNVKTAHVHGSEE